VDALRVDGLREHRPPGRPEYDTEQRLTQLIDTEPRVTPYPTETTRRSRADHTFNALPLRPA
jgi:para-nitrobenzyl esterase